jgi:hypothetical protein
VTVNGKVYAPAVATLGTTSVNVGIVHAGASASASVAVTNTATRTLADLLTAGTVAVSGGVSGVTFNLGTGLASGASGSAALAINTGTAGAFSGSAVLGFASHDGDLSDIAVNGGTVTVTGTVDNYATAQIVQSGGSGTLTHTGNAYVLNFGSVAQNSTALTANLGVLNAAGGPADLLSGSFTVGGTTSFVNSGLTAFSGLGAGAKETSQAVTFNTGTGGVFSETITLAATGSNASNYSGALAAETLTVTGTVLVSIGQSYTLAVAPQTITGTTGNDTIYAAADTLNSRDSINGNAGIDTLVLTGGGVFDLGAPALLSNIEIVTVQESAGGTTVFTRNGLNVTVNVVAGGSGSLLIYGGTDSDVYNLGAGSDTVVLGAATESVYGTGGGTAVVQATAALATGVVAGGSTGTTTLEIASAGTVTLNTADTNLIVQLGTAADTVVLTSATQSVVVSGTAAAVVQATAAYAGDAVAGISTNRATLAITNAGTAALNAADTNLIVQLGTAADTVVLSSATESVTGGSGAAVVQAAAAYAGDAVAGISTNRATLGITNAGTAALSAADKYVAVTLGATADMVVLSSATESLANTAGGTALVQATAALASDKVIGTSGGIAATTLEVTTGGSVTLNAADSNLTVQLDARTNLTLGSLGFITAEGSTAGGETITARGANQTLQTIGGNDTLVGSASFGDSFLGKGAGFAGDVIKNFGGSDTIDLTDIVFATLKPLSFTSTTDKLAASDATHSATLTFTGGSYTSASFAVVSDGHGGTLIKRV